MKTLSSFTKHSTDTHLDLIVEDSFVSDDEAAHEEDDRVSHVGQHRPKGVHRLLHPWGDAASGMGRHHQARRYHG